MRRTMLVLLAGAAVLVMAVGIAAGESGAVAPCIILSNRVPVVGKEIEITLAAKDSQGQDAAFTISGEGGRIVNTHVSFADGKFVAKWIPVETGFYTAAFESKKLGKVSLEFPVVWRDMYFTVWPPLLRDDSSKCRYLSQYVVLAGGPGSGYGEEELPLWKSTGSKVLAYISVHGGKIDMKRSEDEVVDELVAKWSAPMKKGFDGIFMDEFGEYADAESLAMIERIKKVLVRLRQQNPNMLIFPCNAGSLLRELAGAYRDSGSVALLETYPACYTRWFATHNTKKYTDVRIETARHTDLIHYPYANTLPPAAVILLGFNGCDSFIEEPYTAELEEMVRYIKKEGPEMPGIGFYAGGMMRPYLVDNHQYEIADRLVHEYYIKPVVDLREIRFSNYAPDEGKPLDVLVQVDNVGGMDAKNIKLRVYAKMVGKDDKVQIGELTIGKLGCGHKDLKKANDDKVYEYQEVNGNVYAVFNSYSTVFLARTTAKVKWTPKKKCYYSIIAEVEPSPQYTILDGVLEKSIGVK